MSGEITFVVSETHDRETIELILSAHDALSVEPRWCDCGASQFLCYPEDGECPCGMEKHHVHCVCGGIYQIG